MENDMPAAPNIMSCRRPNFSMVKTAIHETRKNSRCKILKLVNGSPYMKQHRKRYMGSMPISHLCPGRLPKSARGKDST